MKKYLIYFTTLLLFGCGNDQLEVTDNDEFEYVEFTIPDFSKEIEGDYEFCVVFPESKDLTITAKPKEIWNKNKNTFVLNLNAANNNKISKAQFHLNISKGAEIGEYSINAPKIIVKYNGETIDEYTAPAKFKKQVIYSVPMDPLLFWGIIIGLLLLLVVIIYLILRKLEIIGPVALSGRITFNDPADIPQVSLNKEKDEFNLSSHMGLTDLDITLKPKDFKHRGKYRKFVRLYYTSSPDASISVNIENMGESRGAPSGEKLFNQDSIKIVVNQNDEIKIFDLTYYNPKVRKI